MALSKADFGDTGTGIASNVVTRATATLSGNTCIGGFTGATGRHDQQRKRLASLATACYQYTLTGTDNAGNNATATSAIVKVDTSAPTGGTVTANGSASGRFNTTGTLSLSKADFSDADSGMGSNVITRATATLSGNACGVFSGATVSQRQLIPVSHSLLPVHVDRDEQCRNDCDRHQRHRQGRHQCALNADARI